MAFIVGLTGGIGSGKSIVADYFSAFKVPIIDADEITNQLLQPSQIAFRKIHKRFGDSILNSDGNLDRNKIRKIIFTDKKEKCWLEGFFHPLIIKIILDWCQNIEASYCIVVAPLLLETSMKNYVDRILLVDCSEERQIERVCARDNLDREEVQLIIRQQMSRRARLKLSDDVLINENEIDTIEKKVLAFHNFYKSC